MPKFNVEHTTAKSPDEAFTQVKGFFAGDNDIRRFDPKLQCTFDEKSHKCSVKGAQFSADINIQEHQKGAKILVQIEIPFLLTPLKGKIEETLKKNLSKVLS